MVTISVKKSILIIFAVAILCTLASATGVRWDLGIPGSAGAVIVTGGSGYPPIFALPGATLNFCQYPANAVPCTNLVTTYTDLTLGTSCPTNAQVVLQGSTSCQATGDNAGNMGVNIAASGTYSYTITANGVSYGPFVISIGGGGSSGGSGCQVNPADNGCAIAGTPSIDLFIPTIGAGTGWQFQLLTSGLNITVPFNITTGAGSAGQWVLGCGTQPMSLPSGVGFLGDASCTPYWLIPPNGPGSGYFQCANSVSFVQCIFESAVNLASSDVSGILPIANGGTGGTNGPAALINLFPSPLRTGDWIYWNGSQWINFGGCQTSNCFLTENGTGAPGYVQTPIPVGDGGTGVLTFSASVVPKGNGTSALAGSSISDNATDVLITEPLYGANTVTLIGTNSIVGTSLTATNLILPTVPAGVTVHGHCGIIWQQLTAANTVTFGIGFVDGAIGPKLYVQNPLIWNGTAISKGPGNTITSTATPTNITASITPAAAATQYDLTVEFTMVPSTATSVVTIYGLTGSASDALVIEPGSSCSWNP